MKTKFAILILLFALTLSCKTDNKKVEITNNEINEILEIEASELKLNNGKKWSVNPETHEGVEKMDKIIKAFKKETNKNYNTLGKNLSKQTSYIIKSCNMVGEPHDQLHIVLVPMLEEISNIKDSSNSAEIALKKLEDLIEEYFNYFKL